MKQIILILALVVGTTSFAQQKLEKKSISSENSAVTIDSRVEKISEELNLTSDQQVKLKDILKKNEEAVNKQESADEMKNRNEAYEEEFRAVLTPEQNKRFDELQRKQSVQSNDTPTLKKANASKSQSIESKEK